jgi:hypothetical protein
MKLSPLAFAAALALAGPSIPVFAQDAGLAVGAKVFGPDGAEVGTVEKIEDGVVLVNTGNLSAGLPPEAFAKGAAGPTIGWNKAQLEAAVNAANEEAEGQLAAALVAGAEVYSSDGQLVGTIQSVADDMVVIERAAGPIALPKAQMAMQDDKLTFLATAADIEAAVAGHGGD